MTFFCYIESSVTGVQHMQPLEADCFESARSEAVAVLSEHAKAYAAHIFADTQFLATVRSQEPTQS